MKLIKGFAQFVTENLHISADSMQILTNIKLAIEDQLPDWDTTLATGDRDMMVIYVENPEDPEQDYYMVTLDDAAEMATITKGTGSVNSPSKTVPANPSAVAKELAQMTGPVSREDEDELGNMGFPVEREWSASMPIDFDYILQYTAAEVKQIFMEAAGDLDSIQIDPDSVELDEWSESDVFLNGEDEEDGIDYGFSVSIEFKFKTDLTDESELEYILTNSFPQNVFMGVDELTKLD